jgi:hypothetical protein
MDSIAYGVIDSKIEILDAGISSCWSDTKYLMRED